MVQARPSIQYGRFNAPLCNLHTQPLPPREEGIKQPGPLPRHHELPPRGPPGPERQHQAAQGHLCRDHGCVGICFSCIRVLREPVLYVCNTVLFAYVYVRGLLLCVRACVRAQCVHDRGYRRLEPAQPTLPCCTRGNGDEGAGAASPNPGPLLRTAHARTRARTHARTHVLAPHHPNRRHLRDVGGPPVRHAQSAPADAAHGQAHLL